ncbi:DUF2799 domain-containing protein [Psychrobacter sp. FDAARGOS_221]|uniref:DUF2799 domain-containing protein n=1 Tax=Psychrobacter sp. FDAARGOS_221 TaxID=1975705 RepID=UPI000BB58E62|nr:DUF2799 domain-containing protein [Psychrobacter sp. FDAARGOS_221]PNK60366.1 DUF2799 domain-containing protein [Psychrobacter sp. FDAARGOS_221]
MNYLRITVTSSALVGALALLSGCATTQALSPEQCQAGNWKEIGYADGTVGRSGNYFGRHVENCAPVAGSTPNRVLWEEGRQQGLKEYCTELNAYKLGREGLAWQPVCPMENIEKLEEAYSQGRYYYIRQRDLNYLSSPYPWGYGRYGRYGYAPYGYYSPFWHPVW